MSDTTLMQNHLYRNARTPALGLIVSFGRYGFQYAHTVTKGRKYPRVRIWRKSSNSWTKPRPLHVGMIVREATQADRATYAPSFSVEWDRNW